MLGLLRRVFSSSVLVPAKRSLYISLVRSQLLYCSSVWHPYLLVDIKYLECVQRRATKFIASNPLLDYRNRLIHLNLLPLMMEFEIVDIMFLVKSVKFPSGHFNIHEFVQFCSYSTRAGHSFKLKHLLYRSNYERNFYFNRIPRLWNSLPFLDITLSPSVIKSKLRAYFWDHFTTNFNSNNLCTYHYLCPCPKCSQLPVKMHFNVSLYFVFVLLFYLAADLCLQSISTVYVLHFSFFCRSSPLASTTCVVKHNNNNNNLDYTKSPAFYRKRGKVIHKVFTCTYCYHGYASRKP